MLNIRCRQDSIIFAAMHPIPVEYDAQLLGSSSGGESFGFPGEEGLGDPSSYLRADLT